MLEFFVLPQAKLLALNEIEFKDLPGLLPALRERLLVKFYKDDLRRDLNNENNIATDKKQRDFLVKRTHFATYYDVNFPDYDANYVHCVGDNIFAVGEGPDQKSSYSAIRFLSNLTNAMSQHANKKKVIVALGGFDIDFYRYPISGKLHFEDQQLALQCRFDRARSSTNIYCYLLQVNDETIHVFNVKNMPDCNVAVLDAMDMQVLYESVYNCTNTLLFHHCRAGIGRSASFAYADMLYMELDSILQELSNGFTTLQISEELLIEKIIALLKNMQEHRPVFPAPEQFIQAIQIAMAMKSLQANEKLILDYYKKLGLTDSRAYISYKQMADHNHENNLIAPSEFPSTLFSRKDTGSTKDNLENNAKPKNSPNECQSNEGKQVVDHSI